jgi:hypothetical protein
MLSVIMPTVVMLTVILPTVVAPDETIEQRDAELFFPDRCFKTFWRDRRRFGENNY